MENEAYTNGGGESSAAAVNEAYINGVYTGLSLLSSYGDVFRSAPAAEYLFTAAVPLQAAAPFSFLPETAAFSPHRLPNLHSLEHYYTAETPPFSPKRRKKQQSLGQKAKCLQKLLPCGGVRKMDTATILEEACRYVKFLQAQVSVLRAMPACVTGSGFTTSAEEEVGGDLGRLNRQQLLEVVVNSPAVQTKLSSRGCCVYSTEQLVLLKKKAERKAVVSRMLFESNSTDSTVSLN